MGRTVNSEQKLGYIDSLRGIAILMVIAVHIILSTRNLNGSVYQWGAYGKMGVQLFFFLSAYTLCLSMSKRHDGVSAFYIRRYFRIAPMYYTGILIYYLVSRYAILYSSPLPRFGLYNWSNVVSNLLLIHGLVPAANNMVVPGGWSIGAEILFYLMFPLLFWWYNTRKIKVAYYIAPLLFLATANGAALLLLHFGINIYRHDGFFYYNIVNQLPVFSVGCSFYFLKPSIKPAKPSLCLLAFIAIFGSSYAISTQFSYGAAIYPFVAALSFVFLFLFFENIPAINTKILQRIGQLSFSIYILHFLSCWTYAGLKIPINPYVSCILSFFITLSLSFLLASFTQKHIEQPGINRGKQIIRRLKSNRINPEVNVASATKKN